MALAMLDLFKNDYQADIGQTQVAMTIVWLPWTQKWLLGLISDTFTICGSRKRVYLISMGVL
jgi:hypothetical protein